MFIHAHSGYIFVDDDGRGRGWLRPSGTALTHPGRRFSAAGHEGDGRVSGFLRVIEVDGARCESRFRHLRAGAATAPDLERVREPTHTWEGEMDTSPRTTAAEEPRLRFDHLSKAFEATIALDNVSFDVDAGEIHALLGANGAGKSTLIKILAGLCTPDSGSVLVDGAHGARTVSFIHQDLGLVETMTVAENVAVTRGFPRRAGLIDRQATRRMARKALAVVG